MGTSSWSAVVGAAFAFMILGLIVVLLRWAFSTRKSTATLPSPSPNVDDPRLRVIQPLRTENEGLSKCALLSSHGIDGELIRSGGRLYLAVHVAKVRSARTILGLSA